MIAPPLSAEQLKRRVVQFARGASAEISTHDAPDVPAIAELLPAGTTLYVAHTPKATLEQVVDVALRVQGLGLRASPHIVARRLTDEATLRAVLQRLTAGGVRQVLLVAGDRAAPAGPFTSTLEVLDSGCLDHSGIERVGVAGHPEGNKDIAPAALWDALQRKQAFARRTGLKVHVATQFSFDAGAILAWERELGERGIDLPVHVGIAGPTPLPKLLKFAMQCGVGASLRSAMKNVGAMSRLARQATSPEGMLIALTQGWPEEQHARLKQPHFFSFGGGLETARWLRRLLDGGLTLSESSDGFLVDA